MTSIEMLGYYQMSLVGQGQSRLFGVEILMASGEDARAT
jgi:hypothetical protein